MTNEESIDGTIVSRMHTMCSNGQSIANICDLIWNCLGLEKGNAFSAVRYFWKGFGLSLVDARLIEASPICGGRAISEEDLEHRLRPKMDAYIAKRRSEEM
jgi:hypothetical protein